MIKASTLKPNPKNPRVIKDDKFHKLKESIEKFPQMMALRPLIVDENNIILGGNMRFRAIQDLKMKTIPDEWVKRAEDLTPEQKEEFIIKDNVSSGGWDFDALANEWDNNLVTEWGIPTSFAPNTDLLATQQQTQVSFTAKPKLPGATDDDYAVFEQVLHKDEKKELLEVLNLIKLEKQFEKLSDALMHIIRFYKSSHLKP